MRLLKIGNRFLSFLKIIHVSNCNQTVKGIVLYLDLLKIRSVQYTYTFDEKLLSGICGMASQNRKILFKVAKSVGQILRVK